MRRLRTVLLAFGCSVIAGLAFATEAVADAVEAGSHVGSEDEAPSDVRWEDLKQRVLELETIVRRTRHTGALWRNHLCGKEKMQIQPLGWGDPANPNAKERLRHGLYPKNRRAAAPFSFDPTTARTFSRSTSLSSTSGTGSFSARSRLLLLKNVVI